MKLPRRKILHLAAGAAALPALPRIASALDHPIRPVRWIVSFPAGGANDIVARIIGEYLSENLGQQFIIENKAGAGGNVGMQYARSRLVSERHATLSHWHRSPSHAEKSRPLANAPPLPIAATIALEMIGPIPGTVITLRQLSSLFANVSISSVTASIRSSSCRQSLARSATMRIMRGERTSVRLARMSGSAWRRKRSPCRTMMPRSRRKPRI